MSLDIKRDSKLKSGINLVVVQLSMFLIPLLATPYIILKVGIGNYGAFIFFQSVMGLLSVIGSYGFVQTGVRDIANARTLKRLNYEYSQIFYSKLLALLVSVFIASILFWFDRFSSEKQLYTYSFLFLLMNFLDISFVYQGIEKLKDYVIANLVGNVFYLMSLFVFLGDKADYVYLPLIFSVPRISSLVFSIFALYVRFGIVPVFFSIKGIMKKLRKGLDCFLMNVFAIIYTRAHVVLLGVITGNTYVGYYSIADQLVFAYSNIQGKVSTVYQPQIAYAFKNNLEEGISKAKENILAISSIAIAGFIFTQFFAFDLLYALFGDIAMYSEIPLRVLSLNFISMQLNFILGIQILLSLHKDRELLLPSICAAVLNLSIGSVLIYYFKHIGAAISISSIEVLIFMYFYIKVRSFNIEVFGKGLLEKLLGYALGLVLTAGLLRLLYLSISAGIFIKLPLVMTLYVLVVLMSLRLSNIVDFKNKEVIVSN
ncbi:MAG: oligosaccharide flippase family protein [Nitrospirae bacterium]|nr:oligosaccharide flippase family protein [Nitrospirota bacterium]